MSVVDRANAALRRIPAWPIYVIATAWVAWVFYKGVSGRLGPDPINALELSYGLLGLQLLIAGLAVTPLRRFAGLNLLKFRRALGVTAFFVILAHFLVWAVLDVQSVSRVWMEIVKRPYVTVGMVAFMGLIPLAITSNNYMLKKVGGMQWRKLHKLTYPICILAGVHFLWLVKGFQIEPIIYIALILVLLALRFPKKRKSTAT